MREEVLNELVKLCDLVESGVLPVSAVPRLFYFGHTLIGSTYHKQRNYKCVKCMTVWESESAGICPQCMTSEYTYDITGDSQIAIWECKTCQFRFESKDGTKCPKCGSESAGCNP